MTSFDIQTKSDDVPDDVRVAVMEIKELLHGFRQIEAVMEAKTATIVRHVRDVEYWGMPYGAVIVGGKDKKKGHQLPHIFMDIGATDKRTDGISVYKGSMDKDGDSTKPARFFVAKRGGKWKAMVEGTGGKPGKIVAEATTEAGVLQALNDYNAARATDRYGKPLPESHGNRTLEEIQRRSPSRRPAHRATGKELIKFQKANNQIVDVYVWDDPKPDDASWGFGYDRNGKQVPIRKRGGVEKNAAKKAQTIRSMDGDMPAFLKAVRKDMQSLDRDGDTAVVCYLMQQTAMRVGSTSDVSSTTTWTAFGATHLRKKHVKITGDTVHLQVPSKKGGFLDKTVTDPALAKALRARMRDIGPNDRLFDTTAQLTGDYNKVHFGPNMTNHRLRGWAATNEVLLWVEGTVEANDGPLQTKEEFFEVADQIAQAVGDEVLFDKPGEVFKSYVDPQVLIDLAADEEWLTAYKIKVDKGKNLVDL